jgi:hypothetical protein
MATEVRSAGSTEDPHLRRELHLWEVVVPFLALVVIGYTLFRNVYPYPTDAAAWSPIIAALWVISGILVTLARSAATRPAGERLMAEEGLAASPEPRTGPEGGRTCCRASTRGRGASYWTPQKT